MDLCFIPPAGHDAKLVAAQLGDLSAERARLARRERELRDQRRALAAAAAEHQAAKAAHVKREVEMAQRLAQLGRATARRPRTASASSTQTGRPGGTPDPPVLGALRARCARTLWHHAPQHVRAIRRDGNTPHP